MAKNTWHLCSKNPGHKVDMEPESVLVTPRISEAWNICRTFCFDNSGPKGTSDLTIKLLTATNEHSKCRQRFSVIYRRVLITVSALLWLAHKTERKMKSARLEGAAVTWCCAGQHKWGDLLRDWLCQHVYGKSQCLILMLCDLWGVLVNISAKVV